LYLLTRMYLVEKFKLQLGFQFDYSKSVICNNDFRLNSKWRSNFSQHWRI